MSDTVLFKFLFCLVLGYIVYDAFEKLPEKRTPGQKKMIEGLLEHSNELLKEYQKPKLPSVKKDKDEEAN